jgi:hypothetical protein
VQILTNPERRGVSPTKDAGARAASGEVVVFLDGHCNPERGAIERLVSGVVTTGGDAIITPKIPALNTEKWKNCSRQVGHGYEVQLTDLSCGWVPLEKLQRGKRGLAQFVRSTLRAVPANCACPLFPGQARSL